MIFPKTSQKHQKWDNFPKNQRKYGGFHFPKRCFAENYMSQGKFKYSQKGKVRHSLSFLFFPRFSNHFIFVFNRQVILSSSHFALFPFLPHSFFFSLFLSHQTGDFMRHLETTKDIMRLPILSFSFLFSLLKGNKKVAEILGNTWA